MDLNTVEDNVCSAPGPARRQNGVDDRMLTELRFGTSGTESASSLFERKGHAISLFGAVWRVRCGIGCR